MLLTTRFRLIAATLLLMSGAPASVADENGGVDTDLNAGIEIGIAPFLSLKTLVKNYAPMREYLETQLHVPVTIVSAPDYQTFYQRVRNHEYAIIITPANSAYLAWTESSYVPLLKPVINTRPVVVVVKDKAIAHLSDLRGKTIAMSDALAMVSMQGMQMLHDAGLDNGRDITIQNMPNHSVAVNLILAGEADAAIVSDRAIMQIPLVNREKIKVIFIWDKGAAPGVIYMASPDLPKTKAAQIQKLLYEFSRNTPDGEKLIKDMGYGGLAPIAPEELQSLKLYGNKLKEALSEYTDETQ